MNAKLVKSLNKIEELEIEAQVAFESIQKELQTYCNAQEKNRYIHYTVNHIANGIREALTSIASFKNSLFCDLEHSPIQEQPEPEEVEAAS